MIDAPVRSNLLLMTSNGAVASAVTQSLNMNGDAVAVTIARDGRELTAHLSAGQHGLVVADLDPNPRAVLAELERLTARFPAARFVALAAALENELLLEAMQAGVRRVVAKHAIAVELRSVLSRLSPGEVGDSGPSGEVLTILSAGGGCGATTIAANLAAELGAQAPDQPALAIDLDCFYGSLATFFGLTPQYAIDHVLNYEALADTELLRSTTTVHSPQVHLLASPASPQPPRPHVPNFQRLDEVVSLASRAYRYTIIDAPRVTTEVAASLVRASNHVLLLFQLTVKDLHVARAMIDALDRADVPRHHLVLVANRFVKRSAIGLEHAAQVLGDMPIRTLRNDFAAAIEGINYGKTLAQASPRSVLRRDLQELISSLVPVSK